MKYQRLRELGGEPIRVGPCQQAPKVKSLACIGSVRNAVAAASVAAVPPSTSLSSGQESQEACLALRLI
jgi:hypothetical protein